MVAVSAQLLNISSGFYSTALSLARVHQRPLLQQHVNNYYSYTYHQAKERNRGGFLSVRPGHCFTMVSLTLNDNAERTPWRRWQVSVLPLSYRSGAEKQPLYLKIGVLHQIDASPHWARSLLGELRLEITILFSPLILPATSLIFSPTFDQPHRRQTRMTTITRRRRKKRRKRRKRNW